MNPTRMVTIGFVVAALLGVVAVSDFERDEQQAAPGEAAARNAPAPDARAAAPEMTMSDDIGGDDAPADDAGEDSWGDGADASVDGASSPSEGGGFARNDALSPDVIEARREPRAE